MANLLVQNIGLKQVLLLELVGGYLQFLVEEQLMEQAQTSPAK